MAHRVTLLARLGVLGGAVLGIASPASADPAFRKIALTDEYYCDGIAAGDLNRDGKPDLVAGPFWYEGPAFTTKHEIYPAKPFPRPVSPTDSMFSFVHDFDGDGWQDVLVLGRVHLHQAFWYQNPQGGSGPWKKHFVFERIKGESPPFTDGDGDGKPEIVTHDGEQWGLVRPNWQKPTEPWTFKPITEKGEYEQFYHGTGVGDVNGDGRLDLLLNEGWWEQPADAAGSDAPWTKHAFLFSSDKGGAQMFAYDVNGDGRNDIITSLNAHGWGLAWFEQLSDNGQITFLKHEMMGDRSREKEFGVCFSQPHALTMADVDGDGLQDLVVGKRMWAHPPPKDIEADAPPVIYWFKLKRDAKAEGGATFEPRLIDEKSGVGVQVNARDVTGDGKTDVLTVSKLGTFLFVQE